MNLAQYLGTGYRAMINVDYVQRYVEELNGMYDQEEAAHFIASCLAEFTEEGTGITFDAGDFEPTVDFVSHLLTTKHIAGDLKGFMLGKISKAHSDLKFFIDNNLIVLYLRDFINKPLEMHYRLVVNEYNYWIGKTFVTLCYKMNREEVIEELLDNLWLKEGAETFIFSEVYRGVVDSTSLKIRTGIDELYLIKELYEFMLTLLSF